MTPRRRLTISMFILAGYAVILVGVVAIGVFTTANLRQLQTITRDLYVHPFAVSNAAANMKGSLFQLRNHMLQLGLIHKREDDFDAMRIEADAYDAAIRADLAVIRANFLGDMTQVQQLEARLGEWQAIRGAIFAAARRGDMATTEILVRTRGTSKFAEIEPLVAYILNFARDKGRHFADTAEVHSDQIIAHTRTLAALLALLVIATATVVFWRVRFLQRELDRRATTDFLTGIPNRRHFIELAEHELARALRYGNPFSLAVVDLDLFKGINDKHGHHTGDLVLQQFCHTCRQALRDADILGRIGGEEFAILLTNTPLSEAREVVERVRKRVAEQPVMVAGAPLHFTASFGLSSWSPADETVSDLLRTSDAALYRAKEEGRNRVCVAGTGSN